MCLHWLARSPFGSVNIFTHLLICCIFLFLFSGPCVSYMLRKRALYNDMSRCCAPYFVLLWLSLELFFNTPLLIPVALLCGVDMSVVLATCHAVESVARAGAQSSVLQLRYKDKAHSSCILPCCLFALYFLVYGYICLNSMYSMSNISYADSVTDGSY
jgi:hypothetical protein